MAVAQQQLARSESQGPQLVALKLPPHSVEAEQSLLGALLIDNQAFDRVADIVAAGDFYRDDHRRIWRHIARLVEASRPADVVTVAESIEASEDKDKTGGAAHLAALAQNTPSALNVRRYAELVQRKAGRRTLAALGAQIQQRALSEDLDRLRLDVIAKLARTTKPSPWPTLDLAGLAAREPEPPRHIIADWMPENEVVLFHGHGGTGKSATALHLAVCIALKRPWCGMEARRRRVLFLSAEDGAAVLH